MSKVRHALIGDFPKKSVENADSTWAKETLIDYNLSLTPEERLLNHQRALDTINELMNAGKKFYGKSQSSPKAPA